MTETAGTVAVVVGVGPSAGLGAALCRKFAREGFTVFASGRTEADLAKVAGEIDAAGGRAEPVVADTTQAADVARLFETAAAAGDIEIVAYNAGNNNARPLLEMDPDFFESVWRVSCFGGFLVGHEAIRRMLPRERGTILFTGATASLKARPPFTAFASGKAGLRALAQGMAREFGPQGIHVGHVVIDGMIEGDKILKRYPEIAERLGEDGLLGTQAIAEAYWLLHRQPRSAWTHEIDLRPFKETF